MTDSRDALMVARNSEGKLVRRPLSPHLQVYRLPTSAVLSITHRITGVALSAGTLLLAWWLVAAAGSPHSFAVVQRFIGSPLGLLMLFGWTGALFFHLLAGTRHLFWDAGYGYDLPRTNATNKIIIVGTVLLTLGTWAAGLALWHGVH